MATIAALDVVLDLKDKEYNRKLDGALGRTKATGMKMRAVFMGAAGVAAGITAATVALGRFAQAGGRTTTIQSAFTARVGDTTSAMQQLRAATHGLISDVDLMTSANVAFTLGAAKTVDEMADLASASQALGRALGVDAAFALESLSTGIARQSRLILDNLGLIVSTTEANDRYAASLGRTAASLSDAEKQEAFRIEAMRQARNITEELGAVTLNAGDAYTQFTVELKNFVTTMQQAASSSDFVMGIFMSMRTAVQALGGDYKEAGELAQEWQDILDARTLSATNTEYFPGASKGAADMQAALEAAREFMEGVRLARRETNEFNATLDDLNNRILPITEPRIKIVGVAFGELDIAAREAKKALTLVGEELSKKDLVAGKYTPTVRAMTIEQEKFNASLRDSAGLLGSVGGLLGALGVAVPFLGQASGVLGSLGGIFGFLGGGGGGMKGFKGKKAAGGYISAGGWGIAGEGRTSEIVSSPTVVQGPARVTPMKESNNTTVVQFPAPRSNFERMAQDYLAEGLRQLQHSGFKVVTS